MSAECSKCGFDLVYPAGSWPLGACLNCSQADRIAQLEEALQEIAVYPAGDSGFQDIAKAALVVREDGEA